MKLYLINLIINQNLLDNNVNINNYLKESNATFKEKIKYNNNKLVRINEHNLFMNSRKYIISIYLYIYIYYIFIKLFFI